MYTCTYICMYGSLQRKVCELVVSLHKDVGKVRRSVKQLVTLGVKLREPLYTKVFWVM